MDRGSREWTRGIIDTARWALGELETAPITGTYTRGVPDEVALRREDDAAYETAHRNGYANGVQHTAMWIRGETDQAPVFEELD